MNGRGRPPIEKKNAKIGKHIEFLIKHNYSNREIAKMVSRFNHVRVGKSSVARFRERVNRKNGTDENAEIRDTPLKRLGWICEECNTPTLIADRERSEIVCTSCGTVAQQLRSRTVSLIDQIESYAPERALGESNGLGTWLTFPDMTKLGVKHIATRVYESVKDRKEPREVRLMRRKASKILETLPLTSKTNETMKARKAQISKASREMIGFVYAQLNREIGNSQILTGSVVKVNWRNFVPGILDRVLSDYLPENHRVLRAFREEYPVDEGLRSKISGLLSAELRLPVSEGETPAAVEPLEVAN
jgi:hypothetical protein